MHRTQNENFCQSRVYCKKGIQYTKSIMDNSKGSRESIPRLWPSSLFFACFFFFLPLSIRTILGTLFLCCLDAMCAWNTLRSVRAKWSLRHSCLRFAGQIDISLFCKQILVVSSKQVSIINNTHQKTMLISWYKLP